MSWRKLKVFIAGLPPESALLRGDPGIAGWGVTEHLLAHMTDVLGVVAHNALIGPHVDPKALKKVKPLEPFPRPGVPRNRRRRGSTLSELAALGGVTRYVGEVTDG